MHDVFYFTDIHGEWELYKMMYDWCIKQDNECTIIFGGDAADRGKDGYKIIKHLLFTPQIVYLKGNHEDLFVNAAKELLTYNSSIIHQIHNADDARAIIYRTIDNYNNHTALHVYNGGMDTLIDWILDKAPTSIIDTLDNLYITYAYNNIDFCHAGGSPKAFQSVSNAEYKLMPIRAYDIKTCLWDRNCWSLGWEKDRICVHGHTPTIYLPSRFYGSTDKSEKTIHPVAWIGNSAPQYDGWKIDMDTGATFTGRAYVLNILTMRVYGFQKDKGLFEDWRII